jgi:large subunit ribosomal protein L5
VIGAMVTLRKSDAFEMLRRALDANNNVINDRSITDNTLSFGIKEYIDFTGVKYDSKIGMLGMNINAQFGRKGRRVETRRIKRSKRSKGHARVNRDEIIAYITKNFGAKVTNE